METTFVKDKVGRCNNIIYVSATGVYVGDAEARHLEMKLLALSIDELDMSMA